MVRHPTVNRTRATSLVVRVHPSQPRFVSGLRPTALRAYPWLCRCSVSRRASKPWRHRLRRLYAASATRRQFVSGLRPTALRAYPWLCRCSVSRRASKPWRHRLRRLYAASATRRQFHGSTYTCSRSPKAVTLGFQPGDVEFNSHREHHHVCIQQRK